MLISIFAALAALAQPPAGWHLAGSAPADYIARTDLQEHYAGRSSGHLRSRPAASGDKFGTLMQSFRADTYRGKRRRLSARVKLRGVQDWAGVWMRIDGPNDELLGFDNMHQIARYTGQQQPGTPSTSCSTSRSRRKTSP